jgi:hypothetical protein
MSIFLVVMHGNAGIQVLGPINERVQTRSKQVASDIVDTQVTRLQSTEKINLQ